MFSKFKTTLTESNIFTMNTLVDSFLSTNLSELATITIVVVLFPYLLVDLLFFKHILFFFDLSNNICRFLISAERAFDNIIIFHLMLSPLTKTLEMECISTDGMA